MSTFAPVIGGAVLSTCSVSGLIPLPVEPSGAQCRLINISRHKPKHWQLRASTTFDFSSKRNSNMIYLSPIFWDKIPIKTVCHTLLLSARYVLARLRSHSLGPHQSLNYYVICECTSSVLYTLVTVKDVCDLLTTYSSFIAHSLSVCSSYHQYVLLLLLLLVRLALLSSGYTDESV
ncbi:hypothetical protein EDD17DRAFT_936416 [Pisolithus thermaeus]|nr:hypothetical protein EDD17DRAFT_936416 [Pisolithus thermaeus]